MLKLLPRQLKIVDAITTRKQVLVVAPMGAGKTLATLASIASMIYSERVKHILIVGPKRVASSVWEQEAEAFNLGLHIKYCKNRADLLLFLNDGASHHICVYSVTRIEEVPHGFWDVVIMDESTLFKNHKAKRSKEIRRICNKVPCRVELSGTPIHNGYEGLWHQCFLLDGGKALGKTLGEFRRRYMIEAYKVNGVVSIYKIDPQRISQLIEDCRHLIFVVADEIDLPPILEKTVRVKMPAMRQKQYKQFEQDYIVQFERETSKSAFSTTENIVAFSRVSLGMKLRQFASGFMYNDDSHETWIEVHREKIEALRELHETHDGPILVTYQFQSEYAELLKAFPAARRLQTNADIEDWNARRIPIGLVHPMSCGHGLNLQKGGCVLVWFSLTYDAELYAQLNKRLHRPGQRDTVSVIHLIAEGTIDEKLLKILHAKEDHAKRFEQDG